MKVLDGGERSNGQKQPPLHDLNYKAVIKSFLLYNFIHSFISYIRYSGIKYFKYAYFQCFKNPAILQKLIDLKGRLPETKCTISRSA